MATDYDNFADESLATRGSSVIKMTVLEKDLTPSHLTLEDLLDETRQYLAPQDQEKIRRAYDIARRAHKGAVRRSGEPYIQHPLEVALTRTVSSPRCCTMLSRTRTIRSTI